ncbi:hypothetical protein GDO81_029033 [Engystomops pustulosus]|uniref:Uncharacterized protein n=1 Tax=Engystomops pustulosus TaxID=76066 RepID=A0AAV6YJ78_ENGPU|nr:hypothetical protein GDO81_029033 [Engystomops pustulosus]
MSQNSYTDLEVYKYMASDTGSASGDECPFYLSTWSSQGDCEEPPRRHLRSSAEVARTSDPTWVTPSSYAPQVPDFMASPVIRRDTAGLGPVDYFRFLVRT